ncbi:MAG: DNA mismatch repair endonuclease MutL [Anaerolineae bacterium]|nr:DNA mismatch repair endonuclease MutL [Anaerolineae bacterium]
MGIQILSEIVAAQIAAGEVVERPASVVKELLENALDAGATDVHIEFEEGGQSLIRVSDNGHGIPAAEVALAFARHATSKIQTIDDLTRVHTLGFRGEALHSIASVCRLNLVSRHADDEMGTSITIEGGKTLETRPVGAPKGTVITITDLFYNTPARLKFLKSATTERRHITSMVTNYALAYPGVRFSLTHGNREILRTFGTGRLADVLGQALGAATMRAMLEVTPQPPSRPDLPLIEVAGYTSTPDENRANRSHITLFVNGRAIQDSSLSYAVTQAYHTLLPKGRYPVAILMITLPPEEVDVNVHPTKAEVRFRSPDAVFSAVQRAVRSTVVSQAPPPAVRSSHLNAESSSYAPAAGWQERREILLRSGQRASQPELDLDLEGPGSFPGQRPARDSASAPSPAQPAYDADWENAIPDGPARPSQPRTLPMLRVIGQVGAAYIVAEGPVGLYLIDQHAAHERILFEQFMAEAATMQAISQHTLTPVAVELSMAAVALIEEHQEELARLGFELEPFGGQTIRVRAVPSILAGGDPADAIRIILDDLEIGARAGQKTLEDQIALRVCKRAAVKAGQVLTTSEMQAIVRQLERCQSPHTCPHGRPTLIHISAEQLAQEFGRT